MKTKVNCIIYKNNLYYLLKKRKNELYCINKKAVFYN